MYHHMHLLWCISGGPHQDVGSVFFSSLFRWAASIEEITSEGRPNVV